MKIAITGKGGVGKTTVTAALSLRLAELDRKVVAIDADPDQNLAMTLRVPNYDRLVPLSEMKGLIQERTGMRPGPFYGFIQSKPKVDDIPERYFIEYEGLKVAVLGAIREGGSGCACPENNFLRELLAYLVVERDEDVVIDMEAGIEHLGRGTVKAVNMLLMVVEPSHKSIATARTIELLARHIGIQRTGIVTNKTRGPQDEQFIRSALNGFCIVGNVSYSSAVIDGDRSNGDAAPWHKTGTIRSEVIALTDSLFRLCAS